MSVGRQECKLQLESDVEIYNSKTLIPPYLTSPVCPRTYLSAPNLTNKLSHLVDILIVIIVLSRINTDVGSVVSF